MSRLNRLALYVCSNLYFLSMVNKRMKGWLLVFVTTFTTAIWGQTPPRYAALDRELWKQTAEQDFKAAFDRALNDLGRRIMDGLPEIDQAYQLGYCSGMMGSPVESQYWYGMAYNAVKALGEPRGEEEREFLSALLNNLGVVEMNLRENASAVKFFDEARALAEQMGDERGVRETLLNQAVLLTRMGRYDEAERDFQRVKELYEFDGDDMSLAFVRYNVGRLYEASGQWEAALGEFYAAEHALFALQDTLRAAWSCFEQIKVLNRQCEAQRLNEVVDRFDAQYAGLTIPTIAFATALGHAARSIHGGDARGGKESLDDAARIWSEQQAAFRGLEDWKIDLLYARSLLHALQGDYRGIEQVIFSMEEQTKASLEKVGQDQAEQRAQVSRWIEYLAELRGERERQQNEQAIRIRNGLIFFVAALSTVLGIIGYRQHRKGQRFLIGIISRRVRKNIDEAFDEANSARGDEPPMFTDLFEQIEDLMRKQQPYLDADLSVGGLAQMAKANYTYTSRAIQAGAGLGVADYINRYRVDYVMELMLNPKHSNRSLEHLSEMSGFNSVSTLYRQFKRFAGVTPGVFRKTLDEGGAG